MSYNIYGFSYTKKSDERKKRMDHRFNQLGLKLNWVDIVEVDDPRIPQHLDTSLKRTYAVMFNHLDMLNSFINSDAEYGIFCEDDILIRKDFKHSIISAIDGFKRLNLDVLLLGYLTNYVPVSVHNNTNSHQLLEQPFSFLSYHDDLWGAEMYMLDKTSAKKVYDRFINPEGIEPFCSDWTITKYGRRACIYPMLAVEEGKVETDHIGQKNFHEACFITNFSENLHI